MTLTAHVAGAVAAAALHAARARLRRRLAALRAAAAIWTPVGAPARLPGRHLRPEGDHRWSTGVGEIGKTTAYVRARNAGHRRRRTRTGSTSRFVAISTRCMHLGCPVRYVDAAKRFICPCHGGVYDFEGKVTGGPPVRPLDRFYTRIRNGQLEIGPRYSVNGELDALPVLPRPRPGPRRHRPVPVPRPLLDPAGDRRHAKLPAPPLPTPSSPRPSAPASASKAGRRSTTPRRPASPPSTGSTSAPRCPAACAG